MTKELEDHLAQCEKAMQSVKPILGRYGFPDDSRTLTVIGFISWLIEHHEAVMLLVVHDMPGSASALLRPVVEGSYRALWVNLPASDEEIKRFNEKDAIDLAFGQVAEALDATYDMGNFFREFKTRTWKHLNSYTHGGMHQIGRRFAKHEVANNYADAEIIEMSTTATTIILVAISFFLKRQGHMDAGDEVQRLLETYGAKADGTDSAAVAMPN